MEESINLYEKILREFKIKKQDISTYSPLTLAYIGDGIYEIVIRSLVVGHGNGQVNKLHKKSSSLVKAETQSKIIKLLMDEMTEEEVHIFKRGEDIKFDSQNLDLYNDTRQQSVIDNTEIMGNENNLYFEFGGIISVARVSKYEVSKIGDVVDFVMMPQKMHFFDEETERAVF